MSAVRVPKLNNNDAGYILLEWLAKDGSAVRPGDPVALIETSKTVEELPAEEEGVLHHILAEGAECEPGQEIARIGDVPAAAPDLPRADPAAASDVIITAPARQLMTELGISDDRVQSLGKKVIRREDVAALASAEPPSSDSSDSSQELPASEELPTSEELPLSRVQRRIADVVELSHQTIPAAFTMVKIDVEDALILAQQLTPRLKTLIGLTELLIKALAALVEDHPAVFAEPTGPRTLRRAGAANVGVTMDVGKGLFVPVVHDATNRRLADISWSLMRYRVTALRGVFQEEDLTGANIVLTLHNESAVTLAVPIIFPGHVCALSLPQPQREVVATGESNPDGTPVIDVRRTVQLGLAYDHRFMNGRDAVLFLDAIKRALESPDALG